MKIEKSNNNNDNTKYEKMSKRDFIEVRIPALSQDFVTNKSTSLLARHFEAVGEDQV